MANEPMNIPPSALNTPTDGWPRGKQLDQPLHRRLGADDHGIEWTGRLWSEGGKVRLLGQHRGFGLQDLVPLGLPEIYPVPPTDQLFFEQQMQVALVLPDRGQRLTITGRLAITGGGYRQQVEAYGPNLIGRQHHIHVRLSSERSSSEYRLTAHGQGRLDHVLDAFGGIGQRLAQAINRGGRRRR
jgi:hypothetical protein